MENKGGDPLNPDNWTRHELGQMEGAWWVDYNSPKDFNNNGNSGDILVSARAGGRAPSSATGGIFIYLKPDDQIVFDDINENGRVTELFTGSDPDGLFWYETFQVDDEPGR